MNMPIQRLLLPLALMPVFNPALAADDAALQQCRRLTEAAPRLACYDALPLAGMKPVGGTGDAVKGFGLEHQTPAAQLTDIESTLVGDFDGWSPNERITLGNGQVWQVVDGSTGVVALKSARVKVRRGVLGNFHLEFDGSNRSPKVRRVQ